MVKQMDLRISQKIQISTKEREEWFNSNVQDIRENVISIGIPYFKEQPLMLHRGDEVRVRFITESAKYSFSTRVTGEVKDNIDLYQLAYPNEISRIQQRNYVRLPVLLDVEYFFQEHDKKRVKPKKATTVDLSGGGMRIAVRERIQGNTRLVLKFTLPLQRKNENIELLSRVIRFEVIEPDRELYHLALVFENITYHQEDLIIRFIFEKMAQQKRLR